ncbi:DUF927 domain-containing protein [uncultured Ruminococcus sp.]|uniref:DUF927 domain-containing protein n=1 Tax=uncultured Ruminococcus sp. TaxID=165186 RepID=UPI002623AD61|nr:DUF927 domain-containing protein [uncultured Ruminococcus sp.]
MELKQEQLSSLSYGDAKAVVDVLSDMILLGDDSHKINTQIATLRQNAIEKGKQDVFDRCFRLTLDGLAEYITEHHLNIQLIYTKDDFLNSTEPYEDAFRANSPFLRQQRLQQLAENAKAVGFTGFQKMFKTFEKSMRLVNSGGSPDVTNPTTFPNQPMELDGGEWLCDENGVKRTGSTFEEVACCHPIMPVERLVNIDTGEEKLKIAYSKGKRWRYAVYGKDILFVANKITQLASIGIAVTSENAKLLVKYLCDVENKNYDILPERRSVGRLGYVGDDGVFSPYQPDLIFDGESGYSEMYKAIRTHGSFDTWKETAILCRKESRTAQILLAASFASVLLCHIGALPFFVHLWGVESGTGKTVGLMLAASVWGDPTIGRYVQTFNATQVSHERTAGFLNNIPMCIDELQLSKDSHGKSKFDVYQLAQGVGRGRGNRSGGVDRTPTWSLCILTTGESPIVQSGAGAGAVNRVIDIECRTSEAVVRDGMAVSAAVKQNFGHAGKAFVECLTAKKIEAAKAEYAVQFKALSTRDTTEKQAMAAAAILTADKLADELIFHTGQHLTADEIAEFLQTKASVSAGERGYQYMCDWVAMHANKFALDNVNSEVYGTLENGWAYINSSVFRKAAQDAGYDSRALLSWMKSRGLILTRGRNFTRGKRIHGVNTECVTMKLPDSSKEDAGIPYDSIENEMEELL